ncbi:D-amino-acid dehydrogenase OS=Castellaniella defragrans OX=75697 GN=HNR28_002602 PE=4 SV=1 [Castellaniella defragrans]
MDSKDKHEVTIIGAGVIGLSCAYYLRSEGWNVTVVDPNEIGSGASGGNAGGFGVSEVVPLAKSVSFSRIVKWLLEPSSPLVIRWSHLPRLAPWLLRFLMSARPAEVERLTAAMASLCDRTYPDYEPLLEGAGLRDMVHRAGAVSLYRTRGRYLADQDNWQLRERHGVRFEVLDRRGLHALEPDVSAAFSCGVLHNDWGHVTDPAEFTRRIARAFVKRGGRILPNKVTAIRCSGAAADRIEFEGGASLPVDRLVIAAGAWSGKLTAQLGIRVPLETERGYHVMLPRSNVTLGRELIHADEGFVITPMAEGLRIAGTVELAGLDTPPRFYRAKILIGKAKEIFPNLDSTDAAFWMGNRPSLPDSLPVIGAAPGLSNVFLAFGHGHVGLTLAGVTGRIIRDLICSRPPPVDIAPFRAERFR